MTKIFPLTLRAALVLVISVAACQSAHAVDLPDSPDGTVKAVLESLADKHPEVLWQALPESYQRDITEVTHAFAVKMDPELWDAAFGLGNKAVGILRDKKEYILESSFLNQAGDRHAQIEENWDTGVAMLDSLFSSEVSNLDNLKTIDWEHYLSTTGAEMMDRAADISSAKSDQTADEDFIKTLQQVEVELVSREGDVGTVRLSAPDEDPEEVSLTLVEGRWVPTDMATDWDSEIADAKREIADMSEEEMAQNKMQAMMVFGMADAMLEQLRFARSHESCSALVSLRSSKAAFTSSK
jgi:hypothetical protein